MKFCKIVTLILFSIFISCNSEDDCHEVVANVVSLKVQIIQTNGINLFENNDFDTSVLKILSSSDNSIEIDYIILGNIIELKYTGNIIFNYNGENKTSLIFSNIESESNNCGAITSFKFTAESNGQFVCECDSNDLINVGFDI